MKVLMKRRPTALLGALAVATFLAGCTDGADSGGGSKSITMWTFKQSHVEALEAVGREWGKKSDYTVKVQAFTPDEAYETKVRAAVRTRDLPDIITTHSGGQEWQFAQAGMIRDITDQFDQAWRERLLPSAVSGTTLTQEIIDNASADPSTTIKDLTPDHFYAVPYLAGTPGLVYAYKPALEQAGLDPEKAPGTWEAWVSAMKATTAKNPEAGGLAVGLQVPQTGYYWLYRPMAFGYLGRDAFTDRQGRNPGVAWDSPRSVETLRLYDQLTDLWMPGVLALGIDEADQAFARRKASWLVGGTFTLPFLVQQGVDPNDILVFPVPPAQDGALAEVTFAPSPLLSAGVTTTSKNDEAAIEFLKFLTSPEGAKIFGDRSRDVPATALGAEALSDPLIKTIVAALGTEGPDTFEINDFSADPGAGSGKVTEVTAIELTKLPARKATPEQIADTLTRQYAAAWAKQK